jgi:hypothetical protein
MTTSRLTAVLALALASLGAASSVSCTAILAPRDDVQRCGTADDCEPTGDNRYVPVCRFPEDSSDLESLEVDKICVADFKSSVGCNPGSYTTPDHPFKLAFDDLAVASRYTVCDAETQLGTRGCRPMGGSCQGGLEVNDVGVCDDTDPDTPMLVIADSSELIGLDVRDQFCRSFFCDDRFVCDTSANVCVLCDPEQPYGEGGCGEIWYAGARSCVYEDGNACEGPDVTDTKVTFGACD